MKKIARNVYSIVKTNLFRLDYYLRYHRLKSRKLTLPSNVKLADTLKYGYEWKKATKTINKIGLNSYSLQYKNWDSLAMLSIILNNVSKDAYILDAGGELISTILPWLSFYGYKNLMCINLDIHASNLGPIKYSVGDITNTTFSDNTFDVIICQSVVEHGVDLEKYFKECNRILKRGGILITSTDYWKKKINTNGIMAYGSEVNIFSAKEINNILTIAKKHNFKLLEKLDFQCKEKVVKWKKLSYTFIYFTLKKQ